MRDGAVTLAPPRTSSTLEREYGKANVAACPSVRRRPAPDELVAEHVELRPFGPGHLAGSLPVGPPVRFAPVPPRRVPLLRVRSAQTWRAVSPLSCCPPSRSGHYCARCLDLLGGFVDRSFGSEVIDHSTCRSRSVLSVEASDVHRRPPQKSDLEQATMQVVEPNVLDPAEASPRLADKFSVRAPQLSC